MKLHSIFAATVLSVTTAVTPAMAQVTSVSQLRDVPPTEWSYQAISNLITRYGCASSYPDLTFRPGQPATRAELSALVNACLDRITEYYTEADARTAAALRVEFSRELGLTSARVNSIVLESARRNQGVGNYLGAGVLTNTQGVDGNGYAANRNVLGATIQSRYVLNTFSNQNAISVRPYVNIVSSPSNQIGAAGGALLTYDLSLARASSGVSKANLYLGAGYQVPFVNNSSANYQSAVGDRGQVAFVVGAETRLSNSLVGFADVKFPTTTSANSYGVTNGSYSPVFTIGAGFKFN